MEHGYDELAVDLLSGFAGKLLVQARSFEGTGFVWNSLPTW